MGLAVLGTALAIDLPAAPPMPPAPPSMAFQPVAPQVAMATNAAIPISDALNPAAEPFHLKGDAASRAQATQCLAEAIYYEAATEPLGGQRAVAQVVLNRVRHPAFPASVCGVVYQGSNRATGCQFTFTCDGSLNHKPQAAGWKRALSLAAEALAGAVHAPTGLATHYHANYVLPVWAASLAKNDVEGLHLFYRWNGAWGQPKAFVQNYSGREANAALLRAEALAAYASRPARETAEGDLAELVEQKGVEALPLTPSMRGDKRVAVRFSRIAREAADKGAEKAATARYSDRVAASDTLRWTLSNEASDAGQAPLGSQPTNPSAPSSGKPRP